MIIRGAPMFLLLALFLPGAFGVANAYGQVGGDPSDPSTLHAVATWIATVFGLVAPAGSVIGTSLLWLQRSCSTLDDVDVHLMWQGRLIRLTIDNPARWRSTLEQPPAD